MTRTHRLTDARRCVDAYAKEDRTMLSGHSKMGLALVASLISGAASAPVQAQGPSTEGLLRSLIAHPSYQAAVLRVAQQQATDLLGQCADVKFANPQTNFTVAEPVLFEKQNGRDVLSKGAWVMHFKADACGTLRQFNILTRAAGAGQGGDIAMLLPGTTKASEELQHDAAPTALRAAVMNARSRPAAKECDSPVIVDTRFDSFDAKPQPKAIPGRHRFAWHEIWSVDVCGRQIDVRMDFTPDPTGTSIDARLTND